MDKLLRDRFHDSKFHLFGGGTLISPGGMKQEFMQQITNPEETIGISLGVSDSWKGEGVELLHRMKKVYTRDYYSHLRLLSMKVVNTLSVDLLCCFLPTTENKHVRKYANILRTDTHYNPYHSGALELMDTGGHNLFAMSPYHDLGKVYSSAQDVVNLLQGQEVVATRLHANVLAWMAGAKITPIAYDRKVSNFYERVAFLTPKKANQIINEHLNEIASL